MKVSNFDKRNRFNYKWDNLFTARMGVAIPYEMIPVLPGDTWTYKAVPLLRMQALLAPVMGEVVVRQHSFFVPNRIVWPKFYEGFMIPTDNDDGTYTTATFPTITHTWTKGSLGDYLHYPLGVSFTSSALETRAYQKVIRDWYMNLNVENVNDVPLVLTDGADTTTSTSLFNVNWPKDRFTGVMPNTQRGPEVTLPVGSNQAPIKGYAPVETLPSLENAHRSGNELAYRTIDQSTIPNGYMTFGRTSASGANYTNLAIYNQGSAGISTTNKSALLEPINLYVNASKNNTSSSLTQMYADVAALGIHPSEFRLAWQIQKKLEMDMRGGSRTPEWLLTHYGVRCSDARLQRSEFLGGSKSYFNVSEVLQTSATDSTSPQANMAGHGYCVYSTKPRTKTFEEHGYIVNIISICPRAVYSQGAPRETLKRTSEEFGLPVLSHTIMDAVYKGEVMWTGQSTDMDPLGYRNIYDEYRQKYSTLAGEFRDTLDYWTWARKFQNQPALNKDFIGVEEIDRPFAVADSDKFLVCVKNYARAYRPLPKRGDPGLIDHK